MPTLFQIKRFIHYWLHAVTEHSLHSPFFFDFYINIIKTKGDTKSHKPIEDFREELKKDKRTISLVNLGAGSFHFKTATQKINTLAKTSLTPVKFSRLYLRIIEHYKLHHLVELGTSLGINTLYLSTKNNSTITTFEGSPEIVAIARSTFEFFNAKNIQVIEGNIDTTLPSYLDSSGELDFIFIDANHRYEPTTRYFQWFVQRIHKNSIIVMDDIHYSREMERAWNEVREDKRVYASIDLYRCGILFFDPSLTKQHFVMQF